MDKRQRERQHYRSSWEADPIFQNWLRPTATRHRAFCSHCQCEISARHSDILRHSKTWKHLKAVNYCVLFPEADIVSEKAEGFRVTNNKTRKKSKKSSRQITVIEDPPVQEVSDFIISSLPDNEEENHAQFTDFVPYVEPITATPKTEDSDSKLLSTLYEIDPNNYNYLYRRCKDFNVKSHQLPYLKSEHIRELIPKTQLGIMAEFEYVLNKWIAAKGYLNGLV